MKKPVTFQGIGTVKLGLWAAFLAPAIVFQVGAQPPAPESPSAPKNSAESGQDTSFPDVDLHTLVLREQGGRADGTSALSVRGTSDGTVEVRDASGNLIQTYPLSRFSVSGKVSREATEKLGARVEVLEKSLADRKIQEEETQNQALEVAKEAEVKAKEEEKAKDIKWQQDFKAKSAPYLDRKTNSKVNAVKIDAREIREDGTYLYEGKPMKPVRLFNKERSRYEMAIPVPAPAE
ncbi:MAG: hypothetical protein JNK74_03315 [Candidatus Hydrogenedentes bacterium]|nr:hypothetical protein [Candidatus Hydrogenedentota bacterium]